MVGSAHVVDSAQVVSAAQVVGSSQVQVVDSAQCMHRHQKAAGFCIINQSIIPKWFSVCAWEGRVGNVSYVACKATAIQQARHGHLRLHQCWATIRDTGPALNHHRVGVCSSLVRFHLEVTIIKWRDPVWPTNYLWPRWTQFTVNQPHTPNTQPPSDL